MALFKRKAKQIYQPGDRVIVIGASFFFGDKATVVEWFSKENKYSIRIDEDKDALVFRADEITFL